MTAIQIRVNGKLVATCGAGALRQLVAMLAERGGLYPPDPSTDEVLAWVTSRIAFGDEVSLKYVDVAQGAAPGGPQDFPPSGG
jgi:hypothetical protein